MSLHRNNAHDLQQLVHILQIDPENVRIDATTGGAGCSTSGGGGDGDSGIAGDEESEEARGNDENNATVASKEQEDKEKEKTANEVSSGDVQGWADKYVSPRSRGFATAEGWSQEAVGQLFCPSL